MIIENVINSPEAIVLVGVPGSGKSTWINSFLAKTDKEYVIISSDDILDNIAREKNVSYDVAWSRHVGFAQKESKANFRKAVESRSNIIYDQTNVARSKRMSILSQLPIEYKKIAVVFDTDDKVVEQRIKDRQAVTGKTIPPQVLKDMYKRWDEPNKAEGFDIIIKVK